MTGKDKDSFISCLSDLSFLLSSIAVSSSPDILDCFNDIVGIESWKMYIYTVYFVFVETDEYSPLGSSAYAAVT